MTISLVYDMLFQHNNLSRISVKEFIRKLTHSLLSSNSGAEKIKLVTEIDDLFLLIDTIIPLGLIMNELINNSIRHAFSEIKEPLIKVSMTDDGNDRVILTYVDNGIGLPEDFEFKENTSIGINLIQNLGEYQMHGQVSFGNGPGFNCKIIFPQNLYKERV